MKVVHTYVDKHNMIWKELIYTQYLSALLAKKHYGNISFYGDSVACKQIMDIGIPYDEINSDVVTNKDADTWSVPKIKVYESINEPFLHIDTDTLIFSKIEFETYKQDFLFSHKDMYVPTQNGEELSNNLFQYWFSNLSKKSTDIDSQKYPHRAFLANFNKDVPNALLDQLNTEYNFHYLNETYTNLFFDLLEKIDIDVYKSTHFYSIPNMNVTYIKNYKKFAEVCHETLKHYENNKERIDGEKYGSCYIEQLMLHTILRKLDKEYRKNSKSLKHLIFEDVPMLQIDSHNNVASVNDVKFPLRLKVLKQKHFKCSCCGEEMVSSLSTRNLEFDEISIKDIDDIKNHFDNNFNGFLHVTYLKWYDVMQAIIIDKLRSLVGDDEIRKIHRYFLEKYPSLNLPTLSGGEILYNKLTGFEFTKTSKIL